MDFVFGLLASLLFPSPAKTNPAPAPAAVVAAAEPMQDTAAAVAAPTVSAAEIRQARAAVKHEQIPQDNGVTLHRFAFPDGAVVEFPDQPKRPRDQARRDRIVFFLGTQAAKSEPDSTFEAAGKAAGLTPEQVEALRFVSRHEGGFDAINTWDRARFSWGFIQFAGGYGLRPVLAHFKSASPALFHSLMAGYGVDVTLEKGKPVPLFVDAESGKTLSGNEAEQAYGDDPLNIALFVRAGRVTEVKQRQVEAALRDYAAPALKATYEGVRLTDIFRSPQGIAMLIDRQVHEGNVQRLEWALEDARVRTGKHAPAEWPSLESAALDMAVQDAEARTNVAELAETTADALDRAAATARDGDTLLVPGGLPVTEAQDGLRRLQYEVDYRMAASYRRDDLRAGFAVALIGTDPERLRDLDAAEMAQALEVAAKKVRDVTAGLRLEYAVRNRLRDIRTSNLRGPGQMAAVR